MESRNSKFENRRVRYALSDSISAFRVPIAEASVYVAGAARGRGVGRALLEARVAESERNGIWTLQGAVFPENRASLALLARCGFREVGRRERIAQLDGFWRDVLLLERRSAKVGR